MLRNCVIHISNEQPLIADLFELPNPTDVVLRLTNLRSLDGKRPVFVDDSKSVFLFPYHRVSFVEIPPRALASSELGEDAQVPVTAIVPVGGGPAEGVDDEIEIDEDFLRRIREV